MSTFVFILLLIFGASLLCATLIISAAVISSRSSKRLAEKGLIDLVEDVATQPKLDPSTAPKPKEHPSARMAVR